jgi:tryptophan synthase beta subunit
LNSQVRADAAQFESYPDAKGRYGAFGGRYVPETLVPALDGVVVGSALVEALERDDDVKAFLGSLR